MSSGRQLAEASVVEVLPDAASLHAAAAEGFAARAARAIAESGRFVVALSGGSTPEGLYRRLADEPFAASLDWARVHLCWGDERCVPPDHAASNFRMAREALLDRVPIPSANVHRIRGEEEPAVAAATYERELRALLGTAEGPPRTDPGARFDLVLLGLGENGHTASLFPRSPALRERSRWAVAVRVEAPSPWRVTLTPALIDAAAEIRFLVTGPAKAGILRRVLEGPRRPDRLPAQAIAPRTGVLRWQLDAAAASELPREARR